MPYFIRITSRYLNQLKPTTMGSCIKKIKCETCKGKGTIEHDGIITECVQCNGEGHIETEDHELIGECFNLKCPKCGHEE